MDDLGDNLNSRTASTKSERSFWRLVTWLDLTLFIAPVAIAFIDVFWVNLLDPKATLVLTALLSTGHALTLRFLLVPRRAKKQEQLDNQIAETAFIVPEIYDTGNSLRSGQLEQNEMLRNMASRMSAIEAHMRRPNSRKAADVIKNYSEPPKSEDDELKRVPHTDGAKANSGVNRPIEKPRDTPNRFAPKDPIERSRPGLLGTCDTLREAGRHGEAKARLFAALEVYAAGEGYDSDPIEIHGLLATLFLDEGDKRNAITHYETAATDFERSPSALRAAAHAALLRRG